MTQERRYFSGESETQAILEAAGYYGVAPEDLAYERVEKRTGFIKRRRKALIEVDPAAPSRREREASDRGGDAEEAGAGSTAEARPVAEAGPKGPGVVARRDREAEPEEAEPEEAEPEEAEPEEAEPEGAETPPPAAPRVGEGAVEEDDEEESEEEVAAAEGRGEAREAEDEGGEEVWAATGDEGDVEERGSAAGDEAEDEDDDEEDEGDEGLAPLDPEAVREAMIQLLVLSDLDVEPTTWEDGQNLRVDLAGPESEFVIEDEGSVLAAFDYLLNRTVRRRGRRDAWVRVDCEGFRGAREERLRQRAREAAAAVRERGEPVVFEPLRASARRIVHLAVRDELGVESVSEGGGRLKRVRVIPAD